MSSFSPARLYTFIVVIISFAVSSSSAFAEFAGYELTSGQKGFEQALLALRAHQPTNASEIDRIKRQNQPVIVFVPGILGSTLEKPGCGIMWGTQNAPCSLTYVPGENIKSSLLDSYETMLGDHDNYGSFFKRIDNYNISDIKHLLIFSYDWRQDNRISAQQLGEKLRGQEWSSIIKGRKIIIIAHSMGGLVATYWYHNDYNRDRTQYPFAALDRVVFLGTPHQGTTSIVATLIDGYSSQHTDSWAFRKFQNLFYNDLSSTGHTFPSIYQLFPSYDQKIVSLEQDGRQMDNPDIFSMETWKRFDWLRDIRRDHPIPLFYQSIQSLLSDGSKFQRELASFSPIPNSVYFYGNSHPTPTTIRVTYYNNEYTTNIHLDQHAKNGDGRVLADIAKNRWRDSHTESAAHRILLDADHGSLYKTETFFGFIHDILETARDSADNEVARLVLREPSVLAAFAEAKFVFRPSSLDKMSKILSKDFKSTSIALANSKILSSIVLINARFASADAIIKRQFLSPDKVAYYAARNATLLDDKLALFGLSYGLSESESGRYYSAFNLGKNLFDAKFLADAEKFTTLAIDSNKKAAGKKEELGILYNTLGAIYWQTKSNPEAESAWKESVKISNNPIALKNLTNHIKQ